MEKWVADQLLLLYTWGYTYLSFSLSVSFDPQFAVS